MAPRIFDEQVEQIQQLIALSLQRAIAALLRMACSTDAYKRLDHLSEADTPACKYRRAAAVRCCEFSTIDLSTIRFMIPERGMNAKTTSPRG